MTRRSRHLADDGRHLTDPAARFAGIFVGVVNAVPMVIFSVAQQDVVPVTATGLHCGQISS